MRNVIVVSAIIAMSALAAIELFGSPAATQTWVKNYVATNTVISASSSSMATNVTTSLSRATQNACMILMDGGSNSVDRAIQSLNADSSAIVEYIMNNTMEL